MFRPPTTTLFPYTTLFRSAATSPRSSHSPANEPAVALNSAAVHGRSEEHTSELQSRENLVCRLLLEKKNHTSLDPVYHRLCDQSRDFHHAGDPGFVAGLRH